MQAFQQPSGISPASSSFVSIYEAHVLLVRSIVRNFRFEDATTEDLVQDIFIKAWRSMDKVENPAALCAWLRVIARNHCLNELKIRKKMQRHLVSVETLPDGIENATQETLELELWELEEHIDFLKDLIENHGDSNRREVARLFYVEQKSIREICEQTGVKQNTVLSHLRRFRLIVTKAMQRFVDEQ